MLGQIEFLEATPEAAKAVEDALAVSDLPKSIKNSKQLIDILAKFGIINPAEFLKPQRDLVLPKLSALAANELIDAKLAATAIVDSMIAGEKIGLYSDYDCDGNTSLFIAGLTLFVAGQWDVDFASRQPNKMLGRDLKNAVNSIQTKFIIPSRKEGFGLNKKRIDEMANAGIATMIVMDSGTVANEMIGYAIEKGIKKIVVLDHHLPESNHVLPSVEFKDKAEVFVVNGNRRDENGKWGALSAAPLTNIIMGLFVPEIYQQKTGNSFFKSPTEEEKYRDNLDLAAMISVIADVVSLKAPANRYFVNRGLEVYNRYFEQVSAAKKGQRTIEIDRPVNWGLEYLRKLLNIREIDAESIGFKIGAALNAASRMGFPDLPAKLMFETDPRKAKKIAAEIVTLNNHRKAITEYHFERIRPVVEAFLAANPNAPAFIYYDSEMPEVPDIKGIIASRIKEEFKINAALGVEDKEKGIIKFSIRAFEGVDFHEKIIEPIKNLQLGEDFADETTIHDFDALNDVISIGGHTVAAGMSIPIDAFERVKTFIEKNLQKPTEVARSSHKINVIDEIDFSELRNVDFAKNIELLAPFGKDNPRPAYVLRNVRILNHQKRGQDGQHLEITIADENGTEFIKGGVAFFQTNSEIGKIIQQQHYVDNPTDATRTVNLYDLVIVPFSNTHGKTTKIGFHVAGVEQAHRKVEEKLPEKLLPRKKDLSTPAGEKIAEKIKEYKHNPQALLEDELIQKHISKLLGHIFFDTETTGKLPGSKDVANANAITQISGLKFIKLQKEELAQDKVGGRFYYLDAGQKVSVKQIDGEYYAILTFDKRIWPTTPTHFAWRKEGKDKLGYNTSLHEFKIDQGALDVTALEIERDGVLGPIKTYRVGGNKIDPRTIAYPEDALPEFLQWAGSDQLVAYNSPFDNVGLKQQLDYLVVAAEGAQGKKDLPSQLSFSNPEIQAMYRKKLSNFLDIYKDIPAYQQMSNPALWKCLFFTYIAIDGENPSMRLDDACESRSIRLNRDDNAHDAMEDVGPLPLLAANFMAEKFSSGIANMAELFAYILGKFDSRITTEPVLEVIKSGKEIVANKGDVIVNFPDNLSPVSKDLFAFIKSFYEVTDRNPYSSRTGVRHIIESPTEKKIILQGYKDADSATLQYLSLFKKLRHFASIVNSRLESKIDPQPADYLEALNIEKIWAFATNSKVNITLKGEGDESTRTIQNVPLGAFRKSLKYLLLNPDDLKSNLELLKSVSSYKSVGIAMLTEDGIVIKGHQREFGKIIIEPPEGYKPFDFGDDILHGLKFLLKTFAAPGIEETSREFDAEYDEEENLLNAVDRTIRLKLEQNNQITATIADTTALMLAHKYKINVETGLPHSFPQGATLYRDNGSYKLSGSIGQFAEIGSDIRNCIWIIYQLQKLKNVEPSSTEIKDGRITLHLPQGTNPEILYILDLAHLEFTATHDKISIDLNSLLIDPYHYSSMLSEKNEWVKKNLKKGIAYEGSKDIDVIFDALKNQSVISFFHDKNGNVYISGRNKPFIKFLRYSDEPKIVCDEQTQLDLQNSTVINRPLIEEKGVIDNNDLQFWLTKINGSQTIPTQVLIKNGGFSIGSERIQLFNEGGLSILDNYRARLFELEVRLRSSEINDLLDSLSGIAFDEDGDEIELDCFRSDEEHAQEAVNIANRIAILYKVYADAKAEFESFKKGGNDEEIRESKKFTKTTFADVQKMILVLHEFEKHFSKSEISLDIPNKTEIMEVIRKTIERLSRVEFLFNRIADRAEDASGRIDRDDNRANSLRKILQKISEHDPSFDFDKFYGDFIPAFSKWSSDSDEAIISEASPEGKKTIKKPADSQGEQHDGYKLRSALTGTIRNLRDACKELKQALDHSRILTETQQSLNNQKIVHTLTVDAQNFVEKILSAETDRVLAILKIEGYVSDFYFDEKSDRYVGKFSKKFYDNQQAVADRLKELYNGAKHPKTPFILVDTSSFLSLLMAQNERKNKFGFLKIIGGIAKAGYARIQLTDMVLAEILNSPLPVKPTDFFTGSITEIIHDKDGKETEALKKDWHTHITGVKRIWKTTITPNHFYEQDNPHFVPFKKSDERIEWLLRAAKAGLLDVIETNTGKVYKKEIRNNVELQKIFAKQAGGHFNWRDLSHEQMLEQFVINPSLIQSLRKQKLRSDLGEISIHNNIAEIREKYGQQAQIFVLYQSSDVPARIIANYTKHQKHNPADSTHALRRKPDKYNPDSAAYESAAGANLGEGGWVTTAGLYWDAMHFLAEHNTGKGLLGGDKTNYVAYLQGNSDRLLRGSAVELGGDANRCFTTAADIAFADMRTGYDGHLFLNGRYSPLFKIMESFPPEFWQALGNSIGVDDPEIGIPEIGEEKINLAQAAEAPEYIPIKALLAKVFSDKKQPHSFLFITRRIKEEMLNKVMIRIDGVEGELLANIAELQRSGGSFVDLTAKLQPRLSAEALEIIKTNANIQEAIVAGIAFDIEELIGNRNFIDLLISNANIEDSTNINPEIVRHILKEEVTKYLSSLLQSPHLSESLSKKVGTFHEYS